MKMRPALFLLTFCLLIPAAEDKKQNLKCDEPRSTKVGEDVTLGCHHPKGLNVTNQSVYWMFNNIHVLVFTDRKISYDPQGEQFKGRASEDSSWNPAEGKLSLKISPVKAEDAGTYTCSVRRLNMSCSTRLSIRPKPDGPRKAPDGNHGNQGSDNSKMATGIGIAGGICIGVGILGIAGLVIWCFKRKKCCFRRIIKSFRHRDQDGEAGPPPS